MARYLKAVLGEDPPGDEDDDAEENEATTILDVVSIEQPPRGEIEALERWRTARRSFVGKLEKC